MDKKEYNKKYCENLSEEKKKERIAYSKVYNDVNKNKRLEYQKIELNCKYCNCLYRKCKKSVHSKSVKHIQNKRIHDLEAALLEK
jgi:hypothetical protein